MLTKIKDLFPKEEALKNVFLVGGSVRDMLSGKTPKDIDLLAVLSPQELTSFGFKYIDPKTAIPVFSMNHEELGKVEVALPRKEKKVGNGYHGFHFEITNDVHEDLRRRDFTINAMAINLFDGNLLDPFHGQEDLKNKIIRHISEAFSEDPLRVFRAFRFSCKGFEIAPETISLIKTMDAELKYLPPERIYLEMMKAMEEKYPAKFFENLIESGLCRQLFDEIYRMTDTVAGPIEHHPEVTTFAHAINVLKFVAEKSQCKYTRLAAFLHDVGKIETPKNELPHHIDHEKRGVEVARKFLNRLKSSNATKKIVLAAIEHHMKLERFNHMRRGKQMKFVEILHKLNVIDPLLHIVEADYGKDISQDVRPFKEIVKIKINDLGLSTEKFEGKSGEQIAQMVLQMRLNRLNLIRS